MRFFEQQDAAFQAVDYLVNQGHHDIACITAPSTRQPAKPV
jgi:DNA-binding LacI/PurR family transcriptional regulator